MTVETIDPATGEVIELTEAEARRLTERIRTRLDRVSTAWADLATSITEAYQRRADLALGYGSWAEYAEAELKPSEGLAADVRRQLVGMLSAQGMSTRAIAPTVGVSNYTVSKDRQVLGDLTPERINPATGEVVPGPTYRPTDVTDWTPQEVDDLIDADERELEAWKASTVPAPPKVVGLDGKTYTRHEPKETSKETTKTAAPSRLAIPQPPRYGGNRPKHAQIIRNAVLSASGLCIAMDEIQTLDQSIDNEEAARLADDLSNILRSLKRIQSLLKKEA